MGIVGLVCGFFGSFWLAADPGNAAPLIGIFITGPLGVAIGLAVGAAVGLAKLRAVGFWARGPVHCSKCARDHVTRVCPAFQARRGHCQILRSSIQVAYGSNRALALRNAARRRTASRDC
jgi:hypothetical protein